MSLSVPVRLAPGARFPPVPADGDLEIEAGARAEVAALHARVIGGGVLIR
jgi:hypothetical protein